MLTGDPTSAPGRLGPGKLGPGKLGPGKLGPGKLGLGRLARTTAAAVLAIGLVLVPIARATAANDDSPKAVVAHLNDTLLGVMQQASALGYRGRLAKLSPVLNASFNYPLMARVAVSKHWRTLSKDQRKKLSTLFAQLSSATFAARFDGYSGESFKIIEEADAPRDTVLVTNHLVKPSGDVIALNYLLREFNGRWRIVDVYLDAKYSELAIKRSEFTSVITQDGFDALVSEIESRIAKIEAGAGS